MENKVWLTQFKNMHVCININFRFPIYKHSDFIFVSVVVFSSVQMLASIKIINLIRDVEFNTLIN